MFTGLIEEVGAVEDVTRRHGTPRIKVRAERLAAQLKTGDSICVSGVCLTALNIRADSFEADLAAETVARTSLARLKPGARLNLELPTRAGAPLGGHVVQGHVDGVGRLLRLDRALGGKDRLLVVEITEGMERYVVAKGSIAIEGISLTVAEIKGREVTVAVIPHTYQATNLSTLGAGAPVNIEVDVLAKYAEKRDTDSASHITLDRLLAEGF